MGSEADEFQAVAQLALATVLPRHVVFIDAGDEGVGSGSFLKTPGGSIVVLTAKHVVVDAPRIRIARHGALAPSDWFAAAQISCDDADVALVIVPDAEAVQCAPHALPIEIVRAAALDSASLDPILLVGFPDQLRETPLGYVGIAYMSAVNDLQPVADGRVQFTWDLTEYFGALYRLPSATGMSGGPLFRYVPRECPPDHVWNALEFTTISAVQSEQHTFHGNTRVVVVEPVERWADWFADAIATIDAARPQAPMPADPLSRA